MRTPIALALIVMCVGCSDSMDEVETPSPVAPSMERAAFDMHARILGPVQNDDNSDMQITLTETNGVAARLNFLRLTCNNGATQQWGAGNIAADRGSNLIEGNSEVVIVRRYLCRASGRPFRLEADLTDANGNRISVNAAPFHPRLARRVSVELVLRALERRRDLLEQLSRDETDCYRLFHGVAEGRPGLAIDRYGPILLLQTWREPLDESEIESFQRVIEDACGWGLTAVWNHRAGDAPPDQLDGDPPVGRELDIRYDVTPRHRGRDPLLFLDLRAGRRIVLKESRDKSVLNLFAYTGGVSLCALAGGASEVWNVDFARSACDWVRRNLSLNSLDEHRVRIVQEDVIPVVRQLAGLDVKGRAARQREYLRVGPRAFDIVVLDPPRWAKSPFGAVDLVRDYPSLLKPALLATAPGGSLLVTNNVARIERGRVAPRRRAHRGEVRAPPRKCRAHRARGGLPLGGWRTAVEDGVASNRLLEFGAEVRMSDSPSPEEIAGAEAYEALHVPALFQQWSPRIVDAARIAPGARVLDVACGTGILAREAAKRVGASGSVVGVDPGAGMLAVAAKLGPEIEWRNGAAEELPCDGASFDAVASQFGLMFFRDRVQAIREMVRVLAPGGRLAVAVWDSLENSESYAIEVELLDRVAGKPAGDALRAPFVLGDKEELKRLFDEAGVADVEIQTQMGRGRFPNIRTMVEADLRGWLPVMGVFLDEPTIERVLAEAENALSRYLTPDGTVEFDSPAHIVTGRKA